MRSRSTLLAALVVAAACNNGTPTTAPPPPPPTLGVACATDTVHLAPLTGTTVDCSGRNRRHSGGERRRLPDRAGAGHRRDRSGGVLRIRALHPQGGRGRRPGRCRRRPRPPPEGFARAAPGRAAAAVRCDAPEPRPAPRSRGEPRRRCSGTSGRRGGGSRPGGHPSFRVVADSTGSTYQDRDAALRYLRDQHLSLPRHVGTRPPGSPMTSSPRSGIEADQVMDPLLRRLRAADRRDGNGHVVVLLSSAVNAITPDTTCQTEGYVTGFFDGVDFTADPNSNGARSSTRSCPTPAGPSRAVPIRSRRSRRDAGGVPPRGAAHDLVRPACPGPRRADVKKAGSTRV